MDFFRKMVSGDKRRYITDKYNLDLTYITDRVIAMAFPATGMEAAYRNDGNQVANLFKEKHPGHFCIYNLTEPVYLTDLDVNPSERGRYCNFVSLFTEFTSNKYDCTAKSVKVHDCGWHDHHAPPMAQLFEIVEHIHNFLLKDRDNVVSIHCLAGKGRTGTVIVSYLLFSGLFHDPDEAALFFALRRSNNNWGVTGPSQQRYIRYFWEVLRAKRAPTLSTPLRLNAIRMSGPPKFTVGSKRSFTPIIQAVDVSGGLIQQVIWSSRGDRTFSDDNEPVVLDLVNGNDAPAQSVLLLGDVNFTIDSWAAFGRKTKFARFAFNTGMVINENESQLAEEQDTIVMGGNNTLSEDQSTSTMEASSSNAGNLIVPSSASNMVKSPDIIILRFPKIELDDACSDKRTPDGFVLELVLQRVWTQSWMATHTFLANQDDTMWERIFSEYRDTNGVACFKPRQDMSLVQIIAAARALTDARSGEPPKMGGWLTKRGHRVKNWKKRWFALHSNTLEYSKSPKSTTPAGTINLDDIITVQEAEPGEYSHPNVFIIYTNWDDFLCSAQNESDMEEWINTLNLTLQLREQKRELSDATLGQLIVSVLEISNVPCEEYYAVIQLGSQQAKAASTGSFGKELVFDVHQRSSDSMVIQLWEENTYLPDALIGEIRVVVDMFQNQPTKPLELIQIYGFRHQITRVKVKITYRPKALIEAQRSPALQSSRPGMVPIPLNVSSNTVRASNSPNRAATLNSKIVTPSELKELIEILDCGLNESLRAPDMDHPGSDPVWDWAVASSLSGISQPSMSRENRYSAVPHLVDQSLPIYMRPISLDIGLPPSNYAPPIISNLAFGSESSTKKQETNPTTPSKIENVPGSLHLPLNSLASPSATVVTDSVPQRQDHTIIPSTTSSPSFHNILAASPATYASPPADFDRPLSPRPYGAQPGSIKREIALRAVAPSVGVVPVLDSAISHRSSGHQADLATAVRSISPTLNHESTVPSSEIGSLPSSANPSSAPPSPKATTTTATTTTWEVVSPRSQLMPEKDADSTAERTISPASPRSPRSVSSASPASPDSSTSVSSGTASPTPSKDHNDPISPRAMSPSNSSDSGAWVATAVPSEAVLEPYIEETTGKSKSMQSSGNAARERRRNRRPTYDSQHPPEFKDIDLILSLGRNSSIASPTTDVSTPSPSQSSSD